MISMLAEFPLTLDINSPNRVICYLPQSQGHVPLFPRYLLKFLDFPCFLMWRVKTSMSKMNFLSGSISKSSFMISRLYSMISISSPEPKNRFLPWSSQVRLKPQTGISPAADNFLYRYKGTCN